MVNIDWPKLSHAYGAADNIPALLERARTDLRPGHVPGTAWFDLWSALCHQGDTYGASYAAMPTLVQIAEARRRIPQQFDCLHLIGCIELARLERRGPPLADELDETYRAAVMQAVKLVKEALAEQWPDEYREALQACLAALQGDPVTARALFDRDLAGEGE